jgi:hypothetical protein
METASTGHDDNAGPARTGGTRPSAIPQGLSRIVVGSASANLRVRPASPVDRPLLEAMLLRSARGLPGGRFRRGARARQEARRRIAEQGAWIAIAAGGVRGVVTETDEPDGSTGGRFLVEDDWQHCGVATALAAAVEADGRELTAWVS